MNKPTQNKYAVIHNIHPEVTGHQLVEYLTLHGFHPTRCEMSRKENRAFLRFLSQQEAGYLQDLPFPRRFKLLNFRVKMTDTSTVSTTVLMRFDENVAKANRHLFTEESLGKAFGDVMRRHRSEHPQPIDINKDPDAEGPLEDPAVLLIPAMWNNEEFSGRVEFTRDRGGEAVCCGLFFLIGCICIYFCFLFSFLFSLFSSLSSFFFLISLSHLSLISLSLLSLSLPLSLFSVQKPSLKPVPHPSLSSMFPFNSS